jgi:hypothetical protein
MKTIELDLFRWNALIKEDTGRQTKYYIEFKDGFYFLFVQRKKGKRSAWTKAKIIEKSAKTLVIELDKNSEVGLKSMIVA